MFGLSMADTWLTVTENLVRDMNGNAVVEIMNGDALRATEFIPDTTRPRLLFYHFDFIEETISLVFNEPMNISLINYTLITVQDGLNADDNYTLTGGTAESYEHATVILLSFNEPDITYFKLHPSLATSENDTYLSFHMNAFFDTATIPNPVHAHIDGINATNVANFTYYEPPEFMSLRPTAGRSTGGTLLTITGANFGTLSNETTARMIDVYIGGILALNTTVTMENTTIQVLSPVPPPELIGVPLNLTVVIDNSTLRLTIPGAYIYLNPPNITTVFPAVGTLQGNTLIVLNGENFGPPSSVGPEVIVNIGNGTCTNVGVLNTTYLSCHSPSLSPGEHNITVTVDGISSILLPAAFRSLLIPVFSSIFPDSAYTHMPIQVNITGENFGPVTSEGISRPLVVYVDSLFNTTECTDPFVLIEDNLLTCTMQPNLGPSNVSVLVDGVASTPLDNDSALFFHYDDAGNFSFEFSEFFISETEMFCQCECSFVTTIHLLLVQLM